ncbi:hypothetical protein QF026_001910 [Streptomyces aurantiacus]|uniref:hypothetical protein n=1 Tax=Streptomyces aurantiacus TaxID=47760 RepID=UPI00279344DD|nr:hypothetical protein [Streptomyces aurantiacus]MDQ0773444.1 hypothetical protein [Streptomyces aurantiacus]
MAVEQLPGQVREFAQYLSGLLSRLDQGAGWCGVFWQRDPDGMRACLDGSEVPPWDVVQAILQDVAAEYGDRAAAQEGERARVLHGASLTAYDARSGGRDALGDRLDVMLREQRYAAERLSELGRSLPAAGTHEEADSLRLDLAWARDDHERATARCAEIRARIDELDRRTVGGHGRESLSMPPVVDGGDAVWVDEPRDHQDDGANAQRPAQTQTRAQAPAPDEDDWPDLWRDASADRAARQDDAPDTDTDTDTGQDTDVVTDTDAGPAASPSAAASPEAAETPAPPVPKQRSKRRLRGGARGSARFAGLTDGEEGADLAVPPAPAPQPTPPAAPQPVEPARRGARYAGSGEDAERPRSRREALDDEARRTTVETVAKLVRLRGEGRTGEAHAVLVEAAYWPAARFPFLAAELHRAGLGADWATLLWEVVSLPADRLVAAADALVAAGRTADGEQMLRQGVVRPAPEIGKAVLALVEEGRHREVRALMDAYVRVRSPEEAVRSIDADPELLAPLLLEAARNVSEQRHWDLIHALRVAGHTAGG